jgi:bifunctional DNA-binding transcriptional regulator/antitoxin component of YhaV-PrlF toxin-antitoxin module
MYKELFVESDKYGGAKNVKIKELQGGDIKTRIDFTYNGEKYRINIRNVNGEKRYDLALNMPHKLDHIVVGEKAKSSTEETIKDAINKI